MIRVPMLEMVQGTAFIVVTGALLYLLFARPARSIRESQYGAASIDRLRGQAVLDRIDPAFLPAVKQRMRVIVENRAPQRMDDETRDRMFEPFVTTELPGDGRAGVSRKPFLPGSGIA